MPDDDRSEHYVFVPFCLMAQGFQAEGIADHEWKGSTKPVIRELMKRDVNMIQMPCPEVEYKGYEEGLCREPKGRSEYDTEEFRDTAEDIAEKVVSQVKGIETNGFQVDLILGVEFSPTCAVGLQYTNEGMVKEEGIFMEILRDHLNEEGYGIPVIGINRNGINPSLEEVQDVLQGVSKNDSTAQSSFSDY